jgi:PIN domain nuclease of toxin-antitoxin system
VVDHEFRKLEIDVRDLCRLERLSVHYTDSFDRLLISRAIEHGAVAVTNDP